MSGGPLSLGISLRCDREGSIRQILHDGLGLAPQFAPGRPFALAVERSSMAKALNFLIDLRAEGAALNWELNVLLGSEIAALHFAGTALGDELLIVGARSNDRMFELYQGLLGINNEQAAMLRAWAQASSAQSGSQPDQESGYYEELSRLNNEMANLQRELNRQNAELERLNQLKNEFLGMAAHDLRTPLGVIMSYSDFMLQEAATVLDPEHVEFLSAIHSSSEFMLRLLNNLLDVSAIESGRLDLDLEPVDLAALVRQHITLNEMLAQRKGIELHFEPPADLPPIWLDHTRMVQVLDNLISNAIKYSFSGTQVRVRVYRAGEQVVMAVQDQGQGIPPEEQARLFKWFGRTRVQSTGGEKSTGLGLAISQRIVAAHGGRIWVESEVGRGSTFYVALPIQEPEW